jgi:hypothetical protein
MCNGKYRECTSLYYSHHYHSDLSAMSMTVLYVYHNDLSAMSMTVLYADNIKHQCMVIREEIIFSSWINHCDRHTVQS